MEKKLPIFNLEIVDDTDSDIEVDFVSLVDRPAIERAFLAFKEQEPELSKAEFSFAIQDEDERIISGPVMLADTPIYRNDENGEYYVVFTKETIKRIAQKFFKKGYQSNVNLMHDQGNITEGLTMFESWIKDEKRGIKAMQGYEDTPDGSWFGSFKVDNDEVWQLIKEGKVRGFSVEGVFNYRKSGEKNYQELWSKIVDILEKVK
jgi:hypothetical protein